MGDGNYEKAGSIDAVKPDGSCLKKLYAKHGAARPVVSSDGSKIIFWWMERISSVQLISIKKGHFILATIKVTLAIYLNI